MFCKFNKSVLASFVLYGFAVFASCAADEKQLVIKAVPGKEICQSMIATIGERPVKSELCVGQGRFSHDTYTLKIDDKVLLKGIDDETTVGISSDYKNHKINSYLCSAKCFSKGYSRKNFS